MLRRLETERRAATAAEQAVLGRWAGWGALPQVFDTHQPGWEPIRAELAGLLNEQEYAAARASTINAHYTGAEVVEAMWQLVADLGFTRGRVLEPGCGSGNFFGFAPPGAQLFGVEAEPVTARVARALYPDAEVRIEGFERTRLPPASFDLAIGNVPFGDIRLHDAVHNRSGHAIHNHFIVKAADLTRPGGLVVVLTSRYTLDARNPAARRELARHADLLGAVRLPSNAFAAAAGTSVVVDLLVLRRRLPSEAPLEDWWERAVPLEVDGGQVGVNEYLAARPERILGDPKVGQGLYGRELLVTADGRPVGEALAAAASAIAHQARRAGRIWTPPDPAVPRPRIAARPAPPAAKEGAFLLEQGGRVLRVVGGQAVTHKVKPSRDLPELRALIGLRETLTEVLTVQAANQVGEQTLADAQQRLNRRYDAYAERFGPLNRHRAFTVAGRDGQQQVRKRFPSMGGFRADPDFHAVMALEVFDDDTQTASKAPVFTRRVIAPRASAQGADTAQDALALCLDERGRVDIDRIAELLGVTAREAIIELGDLAFEDPEMGRWVPAAAYLSGDVRAKLAAATYAAASDPDRYRRNVAALEEVQPEDLTPGEIDGRLGAPWIGGVDVEAFARETLAAPGIRITHAPIIATWTVNASAVNRYSVLMSSTWGTQRCDAVTILEASLNQRPVTVTDPLPDTDRRVVNPHETLLAREKQQQLGDRFAQWLWEDPERADRLARVYNTRFNSTIATRYDGGHLSLPGLAATWTMRPHQTDAIWRIVSGGRALLGHAVGAGKTATMIAAGMEQKRLGLITKPAYAVPNHMLEQFTRELLQLYPAAKVLVASPADTSRAHRKAFVARCATGDWDAVVLTHSAFGRLPVSDATRATSVAKVCEEFRAARDAARDQAGAGGSRIIKQLEKQLARYEAKHEQLQAAHHKDDGTTFEHTGIDYLMIDEAHLFKSLFIATRIQGVSGQGSQRAEDLAVKLRWLRDRHGERVVTFATATPIANSVAEMYVMQTYLQPDALAERGIGQFDAWAATFGTTVTAMELAPDGGSYRMKTRFSKFRNVPELSALFRQVADIQTPDMLNLPTPQLAGGQPDVIVVPPSDELRAYVATLVERAEKVRGRAVEPGEDNMLKVTGDGRKAALDLRLVGLPPAPDGGKVAALAEKAAGIYHAHRDRIYRGPDGQPDPIRGAFQLVFCDLGTPKPGDWSVYQAVRQALAARGVPAEQVRFIHDAGSDAAKAQLFGDCRAGKVAVLLGSTAKMGVGTNVQDRLIALHHLDAPWRPADIEQRDGRGLRQGNQNSSVRILRYVTEASFDIYMWQTLERKAAFIAQVMTGKATAREIEEISQTALSFAEVKALATGNPLIMEKAEIDTEVARLTRLRAAHEREQRRLAAAERRLLDQAATLDDRAARLDETARLRHDTRGDRFAIKLDGRVHRDRTEAGEQLRERMTPLLQRTDWRDCGPAQPLGTLGGFPLQLQHGGAHEAVVIIAAPARLEVTFHHDQLPADPRQLVQRLERTLNSVETSADQARHRAVSLRAEAGQAHHRQQTPFEHADRVTSLLARQRVIAQQLLPDDPANQPNPTSTPEPPSQGLST
ncbi:MAG: helicase [Micromonosporaceae bacterium]|nr:helicase [Micromonosporaceae bacterium]